MTGPLVYVPADAVANFTVLQNQFSPEFGHSNGGQFNIVVKSGTNSFHGSAYEYFQNRNLNAIDQSVVNSTAPGQPVINPRFDSNRYGGQVGGPIIKNKLFFFANYEYNEIGQASVPGAPLLAPTSTGYAALLAIPGVSAANVQALQKWAQAPAATQPRVARNRLASEALAAGFEELMWIDSDMAFLPESVDRLRSHNLPIVGALYPTKVEKKLTSALLPDRP